MRWDKRSALVFLIVTLSCMSIFADRNKSSHQNKPHIAAKSSIKSNKKMVGASKSKANKKTNKAIVKRDKAVADKKFANKKAINQKIAIKKTFTAKKTLKANRIHQATVKALASSKKTNHLATKKVTHAISSKKMYAANQIPSSPALPPMTLPLGAPDVIPPPASETVPPTTTSTPEVTPKSNPQTKSEVESASKKTVVKKSSIKKSPMKKTAVKDSSKRSAKKKVSKKNSAKKNTITKKEKTKVAKTKNTKIKNAKTKSVPFTSQVKAPSKIKVHHYQYHPRRKPQRDCFDEGCYVARSNYKNWEPEIENTPTRHDGWLLSGGLGGQFPNVGGSYRLNNGSGAPTPFDQDIYSYNAQTEPIIEFATGYRWTRDDTWIPAFSLALDYQYLMNANVGHNITQYSDPAFLNYNYQLDVSSNILLALFKLNLVEFYQFSPYIGVGAGLAFNQVGRYSETPLPGVTPRLSPGFQDRSNTQFAYSLRAGIDWVLKSGIFISAEYQYLNIGSVHSGQGVGDWSGQRLGIGPYHTNVAMASIGYLFDT